MFVLVGLAAVLTTTSGFKLKGGVASLAKAVVPTTTSVKYVIPTETAYTTVPSTCYVAVNVTGNCRKRRNLQEKPIIISLDDDDIDIDDIIPSLPRYCFLN